MEEDHKKSGDRRRLSVYDPEHPPFEPQYLCIYLGELEDLEDGGSDKDDVRQVADAFPERD
jgi:hypothetical protein